MSVKLLLTERLIKMISSSLARRNDLELVSNKLINLLVGCDNQLMILIDLGLGFKWEKLLLIACELDLLLGEPVLGMPGVDPVDPLQEMDWK